jgi:Transcription factor WhiB
LDLREVLDSSALAWQKRAACTEHPDKKWVGDMKQEEYAPASIVTMLEICADCPVRRECLEWGLTSRFEMYGVVGGTTLLERRRVLSARGGKYAPDLYGDRADVRDATNMAIRKRQATEIADVFEKDLSDRLKRWRKRAEEHEVIMRGPCVDCGRRWRRAAPSRRAQDAG